MMPLLTSCATSLQQRQALQIYQAPQLHFKAGTTVQTTEGYYNVQTDQTYYSQSEMEKADAEVAELTLKLQSK